MTSTFRKKVELKRIEMQKQIDSLQISCKNKNNTIEELRRVVSDVKLELNLLKKKEKRKVTRNIPEESKKKIKCLKNEIKALNKRFDDANQKDDEVSNGN